MDRQAAIQYQYAVIEIALTSEKPLLAAPLEDYSAFLATHPHFIVSINSGSTTKALKDRLEQAGYRLVPLGAGTWLRFYDAQRVEPRELKPSS